MSAGLARSDGTGPPPPIRDMYTKWGARTQRFNEERFDRFSIGGGDWAPLALSTIRARSKANAANQFSASRQSLARITQRTTDDRPAYRNANFVTKRLVSAGRTVSILKDTGILRNALKIGAPGSTFEMIPGGFEYGIAGQEQHASKPKTGGSGNVAATVAVMNRAGKAVGRGGPTPSKKGGSGRTKTIGQIAGYHQSGGRQLPKREVVAVPDQTTVDAMAGDAVTAILRLAG